MKQPLTHNRARRSIWHAALIFSALSWLAIGALSSSVSAQGDKRAMIFNFWVETYHDDDKAVTCWLAQGNNSSVGISCLPDNQIGGK